MDLLYQSSPICVKQIIFGVYFKTFGSLYQSSPIHVKPIICHRTKKIIGTAYAGDHIPCQDWGINQYHLKQIGGINQLAWKMYGADTMPRLGNCELINVLQYQTHTTICGMEFSIG